MANNGNRARHENSTPMPGIPPSVNHANGAAAALDEHAAELAPVTAGIQ